MIESIGLLIGLLLVLIAIISIILLALRSDLIWGLLCLLILPIPLFLFLHPVKTRFLTALLVIGLTTAGLSLWGGADQELGLKAKAESMGLAHLPGFNKLRPPPVIEPVVEEVVAEEESTEQTDATQSQKNKKPPKPSSTRVPRFTTIGAAEVEGFTGALFQGKTYDGRLIQGKIINATANTVTLSRSVSQGSATFEYGLETFQTIMVATH